MAANTSSTPPDIDFNATCRFFKSSFARTLSLHNGNNNNNNNNVCRSLDIDLNQHFKRNNNNVNQNQFNNAVTTKTDNGLEVTNNNNNNNNNNNKEQQLQAKRISSNMDINGKNEVSRSLDLDNNDSNVDDDDCDVVVVVGNITNEVISTTKCGTNWIQQQPAMNLTEEKTANFKNSTLQQQQQQQATKPPWDLYMQLADIHENNSTTNIGKHQNSNFNRNSLWSRNIITNKQNLNSKTTDTTEMTTDVGINKNRNINCNNIKLLNQMAPQPLLPQQQQQQQQQRTMLPENPASKVETVLLRNQVDTLQWQLKQVETSCEMYRAVMQEVARFLERYQTQKQQRINQNSMEQISRSKSLYQVYAAYYDNKTSTLSGDEASQPQASSKHLRAQSSNNLIDIHAKTTNTAPIMPTLPITGRQVVDQNSYSAFKDFTWRRSPKKFNGINGQQPLEEAEEKLSQEGFRLFRTIQNLLNTSIQQPDLTQHRNSLSAINLGRLTNTTTAPNMNSNGKNKELQTEIIHSVDINTLPKPNPKPKSKTAMSTVADMLFMRSNNMRDSRLSVRSSTDSSVHSTTSSASSSASSSSCASSKVETDEEATISPTIKPTRSAGGSTTEDESGFSSINSFQDVGVPAFSSTLIERRPSTISCTSQMRPKSMPPQQSIHPNNIVGLPEAAPPHIWDVKQHSNPGYQITRKFQRYSTISSEETGTVLWV